MLRYDEESQAARILAIHYARKVGGNLLLEFVSGQIDLVSKEQAALVIGGFWKMTDLAILDNSNGKEIDGINDIEFWMYKLFIKVNGYMTKNGFSDLWDAAANER